MIISECAAGGFVVTSGVFTKEANDFAKNNNIKLLDGNALYRFINKVGKPTQEKQTPLPEVVMNSNVVETPLCPVCSSTMIKRTAKQGQNIGNQFWGCSQFPKCRGVVSIM